MGSPGNYADKGLPAVLDDPTIVNIAKQHVKSPAQIVLRWGVQRGTVVIPKSVTEERIRENIAIFDFELSDEDMSRIAALDKNLRYVNPYTWWKIPYFD